MDARLRGTCRPRPGSAQRTPVRWVWVTFLGCWAASGCAALSNPVADSLPVDLLPPELRGESKEGLVTIPLSSLRQRPPDIYRLGPGDVVGIYIEGVLGDRNVPPPVHYSEKGETPPALGYPIPVGEDGTLPLPLVNPVPVEGLSIAQAREAIRKAYFDKKVLQPGQERIILTLQQPRQYHILVIRQDSATANNVTVGVALVGGTSGLVEKANRRGTGQVVDLPAYENDVLHALAKTGGLPGTDAVNEIVIERGAFKGSEDGDALRQQLEHCPPGSNPLATAGAQGPIIRIPLRIRPGQEPSVRPEDIILKSGDVIFIEAREADVFYTGGLLPPGEHVLPRDFDLDVVEAIARIQGPLVNGGIATNNLAGTVISSGLGTPSPSLLVVLRRTPSGSQVPIRIDLNRALHDPKERILVQARDILILQETPAEATIRYVTDVFKFSVGDVLIHSPHSNGAFNTTVP